MNSLHTSPNRRVFKAHRSSQILLAVFGTLFCFGAALMQCVPYEDLSSRVLAFLLLTLPGASFGLYFLRAGWLLRQARVVVSEAGIELNIPNFKAGWLFQSVPVQLRWDEICCMQHERLPLMTGGRLIDHYWIHSALGTFLLTKNLCSKAAEVAQLIAAEKGCEFTAAPQQPLPQPIAPAAEEAELRRKAGAVVAILFALMFGIILLVIAETAVGQMLLAGLGMVSQLANLLFIVATVASIVGLWWKARRERLLIKQKVFTEKM